MLSSDSGSFEVSGSSHADQASSYEVLDPDVRLMIQVRDGNAGAFEQLVRNYQNRVLGVLQHVVSDRALAEDLTQDVFLRVYRARQRYTPDAKFSTWLFTITNNVAKNALRKLSRRKEVQSNLPADGSAGEAGVGLSTFTPEKSGLQPARQLDKLEIGQIVRMAVEMLPERQRMALMLSRFEEMSYQEIGDAMDLSVQAVKSLLSRARNNLKDRLQPYLESGRMPASEASEASSGD